MDRLTSPDALPWLLAAVVLLGVTVLALLVLRSRDARRAAAERERHQADTRALQQQMSAIQRRLDRPAPREDREHVITRLGEGEDDQALPVRTGQHRGTPERIDGRLFADIVARETVVKAASWTHGLRRALTPESRNRIRFAMRQESKRTRKARKVEQREALREYRARRTGTGEDAA